MRTVAERFADHRIPAIFYAYSYEVFSSAGLITTGGIIGLPPYHLGDVLGSTWVIYSILLGLFAVTAGATTWVGLANWRKTWQAGVEQLGLWMTAGVSVAYLFLLIRIEERLGFPTTGSCSWKSPSSCWRSHPSSGHEPSASSSADGWRN